MTSSSRSLEAGQLALGVAARERAHVAVGHVAHVIVIGLRRERLGLVQDAVELGARGKKVEEGAEADLLALEAVRSRPRCARG